MLCRKATYSVSDYPWNSGVWIATSCQLDTINCIGYYWIDKYPELTIYIIVVAQLLYQQKMANNDHHALNIKPPDFVALEFNFKFSHNKTKNF